MQIYSYKWGKMIIRHCVLLSLAEISIRRRIIILTRSYQMQRKRSTKTGIFAGQSQNSWPVNAKKRGGALVLFTGTSQKGINGKSNRIDTSLVYK